MKFLFDLFPVILFFIAYKGAESYKDWSSAFASDHFGFLVSGGVVTTDIAPVLLATLVIIVATVVQILWLTMRGKKIDLMLWVSAGLVVVLGGLTIWLQSDVFIKWKPTALYWCFALALAGAQLFMRKNLIQALMDKQMQLPAEAWIRLNWSWAAFFAVMGALNLYVAFNYSRDTWVNFKLFGTTGLMFAFVIGQAVFLSKYLNEPEPAAEDAARPGQDSADPR